MPETRTGRLSTWPPCPVKSGINLPSQRAIKSGFGVKPKNVSVALQPR